MRKYETLRAAHNALCLDVGFDPFLRGGVRSSKGKTWRKVSRAALADLGYPVMGAEDRRRASHVARPTLRVFCWAEDCGGKEGDGTAWDYDADLFWASEPGVCRISDRRENLCRVTATSRAEAMRLIQPHYDRAIAELLAAEN